MVNKQVNKVGIITFHCSYNYGSVLQAFALQEYIKTLGFDVRIINYKDVIDFSQYKIFRTESYLKSPKSLLSDLLFLNKHLKRKNNFESFIKKHLQLTENIYTDSDGMIDLNDCIDIFVCGSDQIWNLDCTNGINPAFFLEFAEDEKNKIAYAPSLAHLKFRKDYSEELIHYLKRLNYISVREPSAATYIEKLAGKHVEVAVDPTLLIRSDIYDHIAAPIKVAKPFIFAYMLSNNKEMVKYCNRLSKRKNMNVIYLTPSCLNKMNGLNIYGASPEEFISYIKNARYIITNSFHATVFSIIYQKQFITFSSGSSYTRIVDLLKALDLLDRMDSINLEQTIDYSLVANKLKLLVGHSREFLQMALGVNNEIK